MRTIKLSQNREVLVDNQDFDWLNQWKWFCNCNGYATRNERVGEYKNKRGVRFMHKEILKKMGVSLDKVTDHINQNRMDNRRSNLRSITFSLNGLNSKIPKNNTSGVKGVYWHKQNQKWISRIMIKGNYLTLGSFVNLDKARKCYEEKRLEAYAY